jgi:methionyl-tRNA formyltransferase
MVEGASSRNPGHRHGESLPDVVFLGAGAFGLPTLRMLADAGRVALVVSQPDRAAGRGKQLTPTPVSAFALERGLPLLRTPDCNAPGDRDAIRSAAMESAARAAAQGRPQPSPAMVVVAFGQKLSSELLRGLFAVNLHGSLLPRWRGAAPVQRALMEGDDVTGISVIALAERMDAGAVFAMEPYAIGAEQTAGELHDALADLGPAVMASVLAGWRHGHAEPRAQDESRATRARKLSRADAWVDLSMDAHRVRARVNGLNPWPGCAIAVDGAALAVRRCVEVTGNAPPVGTLLPDGTLGCGRGAVRLLEVQAPGGTAMAFRDWARGARLAGEARVTSGSPAGEA